MTRNRRGRGAERPRATVAPAGLSGGSYRPLAEGDVARIVAAALAGSNHIHRSAGFLESLLTVAYEQYVIDNDVNGGIMRMLKGIEVSEESLSLDVIDEVCKGAGHFLGHAQTLSLMNSEYLYPSLLDRDSRDDWEAKGARDIREAACDAAGGAREGERRRARSSASVRGPAVRQHLDTELPDVPE